MSSKGIIEAILINSNNPFIIAKKINMNRYSLSFLVRKINGLLVI